MEKQELLMKQEFSKIHAEITSLSVQIKMLFWFIGALGLFIIALEFID